MSRGKFLRKSLFVSVPAAFDGIDNDLRDLIKVPVDVEDVRTPDGGFALSGRAENTSILIDFRELPARFDATKALRDCELIRDIITKNPSGVEEVIAAMKAAAVGEERQRRVQSLLGRLGLTERAFAQKGGGFVWLLVLLAVGASGCFGHIKPYIKADKKPK